MNIAKEEQQPFYLANNESFGLASADDDFLHRETNMRIADDSATETQFFSFCVPEQQVYAMGYLWHHPKLHTLTGGVWGWQGFKSHHLACEMFDIRAFLHERALDTDLHAFRLENGYGVQILEPLKRHRMSYLDKTRGNAIDVEFEALAPPVMYADGLHFEQPMRVYGELTLRGRRHEVSCYTVRDRSWGKPRPEYCMPLPPVGWKTGVFGRDFAFCCNAFDDPDWMPELGRQLPLPNRQTLKAGWILQDGQIIRILSCRKRTQRDPRTLMPMAVEWEAIDENQKAYMFKGTAVASSDWNIQPNLRFALSSMRWEHEGRIAFGELQEAHWTDFIHRFMP